MFKISSLKFKEHAFLPDERINFIEEGAENSHHYTSLIIGHNATGKSQILHSLVDILIYLKRKSMKMRPRWIGNYGFEIVFLHDKKKRTVERNNKDLLLDGETVSSDGEELIGFLQEWIIAGAYTFSDKFFFPSKGKDEDLMYKYIGLRSVSNAIYSASPFVKVLENVADLIISERIQDLSPLFTVMGYERRLRLTIKTGRYAKAFSDKRLFSYISRLKNQNLDLEDTLSDFKKILLEVLELDERRNSRRANEAKLRLIDNDKRIKELLDTLLTSEEFLIDDGEIRFRTNFEFNWSNDTHNEADYERFKNIYQSYKDLEELEILEWESIHLARGGFFPFEWASSGEIHMLGTFTGILNYIQPNSVVLIDEPDISLHPNWQQSWYSVVIPILEKVKGCHFIIASHSHLLVSDLPPKVSSINVLKRVNGTVTIRLLDKISPFAWSAEQVLLDVFDMATDRNYYLAQKIKSLSEEYMKEDPSEESIKEIKDDLRSKDFSGLHKDDPLKKLLDSILKDDE
ncbi:MAG: AAA family ATPase [Cyclobacteriaceae bacterium]